MAGCYDPYVHPWLTPLLHRNKPLCRQAVAGCDYVLLSAVRVVIGCLGDRLHCNSNSSSLQCFTAEAWNEEHSVTASTHADMPMLQMGSTVEGP